MCGSLLRWIVGIGEEGINLQHFIHHKLEGRYSLKQIKKALEKSFCEVNGRREHFASFRLASGDKVALHEGCFDKGLSQTIGFDLSRILYEDEYLLVYNKPPGIVTEEGGLFDLLKTHAPTLALIHRLDKETSGAVIFAKNPLAREGLLKSFKQRNVTKQYLAIVDGMPAKTSGSVDLYLAKSHSYQGQTLWSTSTQKKESLPALTHWTLRSRGTKSSLLLCEPITGRTHQIRVHLHAIGHPILGDALYGRRYQCTAVPPRLMLHAWKLVFPHPIDGSMVQIEAPVPADFRQIAENLSLE